MNVVKIDGMSCGHCTAAVEKALKELPGLTNVVVNLEKKQASYDGEIASELVAEAISKIGFEVVG